MGQNASKAVLVTGGAGYIGSPTVRVLRDCGWDVVAFDSMEFGNAAGPPTRPRSAITSTYSTWLMCT